MDVLIKGMEMPTEGGVMGVYKLDGEFYIYDYKRGKKFPIVELPPHGRLIDADVLYEDAAKWEDFAFIFVERHKNDEDRAKWIKWSAILNERTAFKHDIADAPTVIEASEVEE